MIGSSQLTIPSYSGIWAREPGDVVDWARELRRRAVGLWAPCLGPTGGLIVDLSWRQDHGVVDGTVGNDVTPVGWARNNNGSTSNRINTTLSPASLLRDRTMMLVLFRTAVVGRDPFAALGSNAGFQMTIGTSNSGFPYGRYSIQVTGSTDLRDGRWHSVAYTIRSGVGELWLDGVLHASAAASETGAHDGSIPSPSILARRTTSGYDRALDGAVALAGVWPLVADRQILHAVTADPLALVRWHGRRSWLMQWSAGLDDEGRTADLVTVESGDDACTVDVTVAVVGDLVATEAGADGATLDAAALVLGPLSVAETGSDASSADVVVRVSAGLVAAEAGVDTLSSTIGQVLGAMLSAVEIGDDGAMVGVVVLVSGSLATVEAGADTMSGIVGEPPEVVAASVFESPVFRSHILAGARS